MERTLKPKRSQSTHVAPACTSRFLICSIIATTLNLQRPRWCGPDTERHTANTSRHAPPRYPSSVAGDLTLLLIEDDVRLARFTVEYLERNGVTVTHVT